MAERPIPFSIAVCTLIAEHSDPSSAIHKSLKKTAADIDRNSIEEDDSTAEIEDHLSQVIKTLVVQNESMTLLQILSLVSGNDARFIHAAEILLNFLNESCESIDALVDLFTALRSTVARGMIDGDSAHGVYVRKRCLGFDKLAFGSVCRLWESFCDYVYDANDWPKKYNGNQTELKTTNGMIIDDKECKCSDDEEEIDDSPIINDRHNWPLAPRQISRRLFEQCLNLQKDIGCMSYEAMEAEIQDILRENPELTLAHFLRFLNDSIHGERVGAIESFHQYFDYAMIQERKFRLSTTPLPNDNINSNNNNNSNGRDNEASDNQQTHYDNVAHYSAIILSSLYHKFVNYELAYIATREAIRIAHQIGDGACLAYALGWLHASSENNANNSLSASVDASGSSSFQLLSRVSSRAAQFDIRSLIVGSSLMRANQISMGSDHDVSLRGIRHPISFIPSQAWETISAASTENALTSIIGAAAYRHDIPTHATNHNGSGEAMTTFAQQHLASAGLWQCMGHTGLASTSFQTTMRCYKVHLSDEQSSLVDKEIAYSALHGAGSDKTYFNQESSTQSLCSALERLRLTAPTTQPTSMYQNALQKLRANCTDKSVGMSWCHSIVMLLHESSIQKCDLYNASAINVLLHSCAPIVHREYAKTSVDILGQTCLLLCRQHRWESAKCIINDKIIRICEVNRFRYYHAHYLLQLAIIHFDSTPYDPIRALSPILSCLSLCEKFSIDGIHAVALSLLARAYYEMGNWNKAKSILNASMPLIIQNAHVCFQGEAFLCMAKCILSEIKSLKSNSVGHVEKRMNFLFRALLSQLQKSQIAFEKAVDVIRLREVYYLLAHCHASVPGHTSRRNMAAKKFREMNRIKLQSKVPSWYDGIDNIKGKSGS